MANQNQKNLLDWDKILPSSIFGFADYGSAVTFSTLKIA